MAIYVATVVTIVVTDLLTGVIVGIALAAAKLLYTFSHLDSGTEGRSRKRPSHARASRGGDVCAFAAAGE